MLYLTDDTGLLPFFLPLGIIGFYRYLWYAIKVCAWLIYKPIRPKQRPTYRSDQDVTIIVPTIDAGEEFKIAARSWLACNPKQIIIITEDKMREPLQELANEINPSKILVLTIPKANKRNQMVTGINATQTEILVFADDDAIWKPTMLDSILACFEDLKMGGVGTSQTVHAVDPAGHQTVWEVLAGFRLSIRNVEVAASTHIDGGVCCLSGRTAAYRTLILKDPAFQYGFQNDLWLNKYPLNSGDDKFLTRWMVSHGWNTYVQVCPEAELYSTFKNNWRFLRQVLRWTRNTWRSDFRSLFTERYIWRRHPYVAYTMVDKIFNPITLLSGPVLVCVYLINQATEKTPTKTPLPAWNIILSYICWLLLTRGLKLVPHFLKRPFDVIYLPAWLLFNYYFAIMKLYALCTLHVTSWGSRNFNEELSSSSSPQPIEMGQQEEKPLPPAPVVPVSSISPPPPPPLSLSVPENKKPAPALAPEPKPVAGPEPKTVSKPKTEPQLHRDQQIPENGINATSTATTTTTTNNGSTLSQLQLPQIEPFSPIVINMLDEK